MVNSPAFSDPPIEADVPGFIAPVPEVSVNEPPGLMMSNLDTTGVASESAQCTATGFESPLTLPSHGSAPELDSKVVLCILEISFGNRAPDDLVDARVDEVVHGAERLDELRVARLVSNIAHLAGEVWIVDLLDRCAELLFRRRDDGDVGAMLEKC
jgi:hypothetical protein